VTTTLPELQGLAYTEVASAEFPIHLVPRNGSASLLATKAGLVYTFDGETIGETPILDISGQVQNQGEQGLLSIAVHPEDDTRLFLHYSNGNGDTTVEEYAIGDDGVVDPEPVRLLLEVDQPAANHNGGMIQFDEAGTLFLGLGDGGGANDAFGTGQDTGTLLAKLVRIDPDTAEATMWHMGLRNPWRFWIEGDLVYIADVGQGSYEEVNVASMTESGLNFGWPITQGLHCFRPATDCDTDGLTLPVVEVEHGDGGTCSITGGIVYRGTAIPEIAGHFFYSDYCGGYLRSFRFEDGEVVDATDWSGQVGVVEGVVSFGLDHTGEMYVLTTGEVLRVEAARG
jgi:glucose/arabinose dehydrogenase